MEKNMRKFVLRVYLTFSQAGLACDSIPSTNVNGINYGWPLLGWVELQSDSSMFAWLASPELMNFIRGQKLSHELLNKLKRKLLVVHKVWNKFSTRVKAPFSNQSMESRVKEMTAKLEDIAEEKEKLGLKEGDGERLSPKLPSSSLVDESFVYGRDEIKEEMVMWLLSDKETTTGNNVIDAIGCRPTSDDSLDLLQRRLKDNLGNKKFLLVLDDNFAFDWKIISSCLILPWAKKVDSELEN
ncbi:unnamed protein product, partial [Vitis vinifera]